MRAAKPDFWVARRPNAGPRRSAQLVNFWTPFLPGNPTLNTRRRRQKTLRRNLITPPPMNSCRDPEIPISGFPEQRLRKSHVPASARNRAICGLGDFQTLAPAGRLTWSISGPFFAGNPLGNTRRRRQKTRRRPTALWREIWQDSVVFSLPATPRRCPLAPSGYPLPPAFGCPLRRTHFNAKDGPAGGSRPAGGRF